MWCIVPISICIFRLRAAVLTHVEMQLHQRTLMMILIVVTLGTVHAQEFCSGATCTDFASLSAQADVMLQIGTKSHSLRNVMTEPTDNNPEPTDNNLAACRQPMSTPKCKTSEEEEEPQIERATPGRRVRMPAYQGMEYQLFLPASWKTSGTETFPVVIFLHGSGDGQFGVMNSQSLPRLLRKDQSTCFDSRSCWCLDEQYIKVTAMREAPVSNPRPFLEEKEDLRSPLADCAFADTFGAIVVMPQGFLPGYGGWTEESLELVEKLTKSILREYRGDPKRVTLSGQSAGGAGAWSFATSRPQLWSAVNVICAPTDPEVAKQLEGIPIWVVGWTGDGVRGSDEVVAALKQRQMGSVRYTRYVEAPAPPDPQYNDMLNHASYDLIYRDPRLWEWAFQQSNSKGEAAWGHDSRAV